MKNKLNSILMVVIPACFTLSFLACNPTAKHESSAELFLAAFNDSDDQGLILYSLDNDSLAIKEIQVLGDQPAPSYFELHPSGDYFYMVSGKPAHEGDKSGSLNAYSIDITEGKMEFINSVPAYGKGPCHVIFDHTGSYVFITNYGSGSLSSYPVLEDGRVGDSIQFFQFEGSSVNESRQNGPHAHSSLISHDNDILFVADLGTDKIMVYDFDLKTGMLKPGIQPWINSPPGAGPRHMELHPDRDILYVAEELSSSVSVYNIKNLREEESSEIQRISTLPQEYIESNTVADIHVGPTGKFLYVSNRGHNSIVVFRISPEDGSLSLSGHQSTLGDWPRNFNLSSKTNLLLVGNQRSDNIAVLKCNSETGIPEETGKIIPVAAPICLKFYR